MQKDPIVTVCGDPGGASALVPVIKLLGDDPRFSLINYSYREGLRVLHNHGIETISLPESHGVDEAEACLRNSHAVGLVTATSHNGIDWEKHFLRAARKNDVRSLAVLDFWSNYALRFSNDAERLNCLPDKICAMDVRAKREMIEDEIPLERIVVTGQPAFDALENLRKSFTPEMRNRVRSSFGVRTTDTFVVFVSQPLRKVFGNASQPTYLGFDEKDVQRLLRDKLLEISGRGTSPFKLLVRPHPRETAADFDELKSGGLPVIVSADEDSREVMMSADLVIGMNSVLLVEACLLGSPVVSFQPGLTKPDPLPTNQSGASLGLYRAEDIDQVALLVADGRARESLRHRSEASRVQIPANASQNVLHCLYSLLSEPASRGENRA